MRSRDVLALVLCLGLAFVAGVQAVALADRWRTARVELGEVKLTQLAPEVQRELAELEDEVFLTYFVTARAEMPSKLRRLEEEVTDLLEALRRAAHGKLAYQIVDPAEDTELVRYAASRRAAPFRVRTIARDAFTEESVWSTLTIAYGPHRPAILNGITPEHLPRLQDTLLEHLQQMEQPRRPRIGLDVPATPNGAAAETGADPDAAEAETFEALRAVLARRGEVVDVDLEAGELLPPDLDCLFWMDPGDVPQSAVDELSRFLARGRGAVISGSARSSVLLEGDRAKPRVAFPTRPFGAETLFARFGLDPLEGLFLDERSEFLEVPGGTVGAPHLVRAIAPQQNFRGLSGQPNGTLLFSMPTPFALDHEVLAQEGLSANVLVTTSDRTFQHAWPAAESPAEAGGARAGTERRVALDLVALDLEAGLPAPRQALAVHLAPADPWRGSLFAFSSSSPFRDGSFTRDGVAHRPLVGVLLDELVSNERLVIHRAGLEPAAPLPHIAPTTRIFWRALCALLLPAGLLVLALRTSDRKPRRAARAAGPRPGRARAWRAALLVLAAFAGARVAELGGARADLTADRLNGLSPTTRRLASEARGAQALRAELVFSERDRLPPELRVRVRRLEDTLAELERAGAELDVSRVHPEDLDEAAREALAARGIRPTRSVTRGEGSVTVRRVYTSLALSNGTEQTVLQFPDSASFEDLEFRLAFALWRLATGRRPHVGFASDVPRLSPAEAHQEYQQQGLFAPSGSDVYSLAREHLERSGFRVTHVNPRDPEVPEDLDLLVWLQPRRSIDEMLLGAVDHLHRGKPLLLAAQHFNMQAEQHRGRGFEVAHWPQPQSPDIDELYFPELGIQLERDVLFDTLMTTYEQTTEVNLDADDRQFEKQSEALPFLIRAVGANFADHPITRGLGDQAFLWGNRVSWDADRFELLGFEATPLIHSSARSWTYLWKGGFLPPEVLAGPPDRLDEDGQPTGLPAWSGPQALAVLFRGKFPTFALDGVESSGAADHTDHEHEDSATELLLVGDSEMFKNHRLFEPDFRADQLLLNGAAHLALEPALAALAGRRSVARGFDWVEPKTRLAWRAGAVALGPVLLALFGLARALVRRRPPQLLASGGASRRVGAPNTNGGPS